MNKNKRDMILTMLIILGNILAKIFGNIIPNTFNYAIMMVIPMFLLCLFIKYQ